MVTMWHGEKIHHLYHFTTYILYKRNIKNEMKIYICIRFVQRVSGFRLTQGFVTRQMRPNEAIAGSDAFSIITSYKR